MATTTIFDSPTALGLKPIIIETTVTNVSGAYTATINDERITVAMRPIDIEIEHPEIFNANISVTCNNGSVTISCADVSGTSGVVISILKVTEEDPITVTSAEFDILNNRKVDKDQGVANAGKALGINAQGIVEPVPFSGEDFTGATSSTAGTHGYVPAPSAGDQGKFLKGSGAWATVPFPPTMGGATSSDSGVSGLVPTPAAGDQEKVLTGAGTWVTPVGSRVLIIDLDDVTNTSGSYTHTTTVNGMTGDLKAVAIECSDPTIFKARVSVITATDSVTLICDEVAGTSTVKVSFLAIGNANPLSSTEYGALDARIGSLSNLNTTDKSSVVNAVNEVNNKGIQMEYIGYRASSGDMDIDLSDYKLLICFGGGYSWMGSVVIPIGEYFIESSQWVGISQTAANYLFIIKKKSDSAITIQLQSNVAAVYVYGIK